MMSVRFLATVSLILCTFWASAGDVMTGLAVRISDGDTIKLFDAYGQLRTIRLAGIDAPEKAQEFGPRARQELTELCLNKLVEAQVRTTDRFGRTVARVRCDGVDAATKMLEMGLAWHFTRYARSQPPQEARADQLAQEVARGARLGLWSKPNPMAPWERRSNQRDTSSR